jgi:uncharacterized membrane protein
MALYTNEALLYPAGRWVMACTTCNRTLQDAIFNSTFYPNLFMMLSAFIVLGIIVAILGYLTARREKKRYAEGSTKLTVVPLVSASTTIGIGIGGFIDGTFLHQILQWHEMLSNKIPPLTLLNKSVNMFWDGVFHAFCLVVTLVGIFMLFKLFFRKDVLITYSTFIGGLLLGWAVFNIVEGIIDHQLLKLHNVREVTPNIEIWNMGFLGFSVLMALVGYLMIAKGRRNTKATD